MVVALVQAVRLTHPKSHDATFLQLAADLRPHFLDCLGGEFFVEVQVDDPCVGPSHEAAVSQDAHGPLLRLTDVAKRAIGPALRLVMTRLVECGLLLVYFAAAGTTIIHRFTAVVLVCCWATFIKTTMLHRRRGLFLW